MPAFSVEELNRLRHLRDQAAAAKDKPAAPAEPGVEAAPIEEEKPAPVKKAVASKPVASKPASAKKSSSGSKKSSSKKK